MDLLLLLGLFHVIGLLVWAASALVLGLILLAGRRDESALRAVREAALLDHRALSPAMLVTLLSGAALAGAAGLATEGWALLSASLCATALGLGRAALRPACARALRWDGTAALAEGRRALRLARLSLGCQLPALVLMALQPGWGGVAVLLGLMACLALAAALLDTLGRDASAKAA